MEWKNFNVYVTVRPVWLWASNSSVGKAPDYKKFWDPGLNLCLVHHYFYHSFLVNFTQMLYVYVYPISYISTQCHEQSTIWFIVMCLTFYSGITKIFIMIEVTGVLPRGSVYLAGETVKCIVTIKNLSKLSQ